MAPPESGVDRRLWPRVELDARVVISFTSVDELASGPLVNLSEGGAYIRTTRIKPVGTHLWVRISVESEGLVIETEGEVMRAISLEQADLRGVVPGMGIRFLTLRAADRDAIRRLVAAVLARGGAGA
jgi:uncharacterized protein (TIGR02266 family)